MSEIWTRGTWTVIPGREDEFVEAWTRMSDWTVAAFPSARGRLLRDVERPHVFISFGPWPDRETALRWRGSSEFQEHLAAIRATLHSFEPLMMEPVVERP
ncbi:MAG TPA: antibiotic biosynthesis monooxygenase [Acidimicrobiales bacterium]|jgi:heme-degrading monooxygenase HmoA|nr:antibiotic biosynthesis monooxygenase [Acidimicrobiales bacterium]